MINNDHEYFAQRARQEDEAARLATCDEARMSHQLLADAYRRRSDEVMGAQPRDGSLVMAAYPMKIRKPIETSKTHKLAARPITAPTALCRA